MSGSMATAILPICLTVVALAAMVFAARWIARGQVPQIAADTVEVLTTRVTQLEMELAETRRSLADLQVRHQALLIAGGTRTPGGEPVPLCSTCPLVSPFRGSDYSGHGMTPTTP